TLDTYYIRSKIFEFIKVSLPLLTENLLDVGCGKMPYRTYILNNALVKNYVGLDIETAIAYDTNVSADLTWDGVKMPINDNEFATVMATEVLEHCPHPNVVLSEIYRVMKPNGVFIFTVPFLWNLHETPHDEYRYTPFALQRLLSDAGFAEIAMKPTGGWHASMAQMLGLWVCRATIPSKLRWLLKRLILPVYRLLLKKEKGFTNFNEGLMITGICGIAHKKQ
ncbi:MAG: class I SAM-dependent methyltransferase, partial [Chitinophagaceae bacterium]